MMQLRKFGYLLYTLSQGDMSIICTFSERSGAAIPDCLERINVMKAWKGKGSKLTSGVLHVYILTTIHHRYKCDRVSLILHVIAEDLCTADKLARQS